jgi:RNA polymerase sigma-70 factor (ECF subfamily)
LYASAAKALGKDENAVGVLLHRLRKDFGALLRSEIAQTVVNRTDIDQELRYLLEAWSGVAEATRKG